MKNNTDKHLTLSCVIALTVNLILFAIKLYIGLSSNSISIYSDGINNLTDSLSGGLALTCLMLFSSGKSSCDKPVIKGTENLLSFIMSVAIGITGSAFACSSIERLMYPTPVWYRQKYLVLLIATAAVKLILHFIFRVFAKSGTSPVIRVMAFDSLLDFFITAVAAGSLLVSAYGTYSIDALCGIAISIVIIASAVKMILSSAGKLTGFIPKEKRQRLAYLLGEDDIIDIVFYTGGDSPVALAQISPRTVISEETLIQIKNETGVTVHINYRKENTENLCNNHDEN